MATQPASDGPDNNSLAISPSLVVGIVIVVAFFCTIIFASVYRFCGRRGKANGLTSAAFAAHDSEGLEISSEAALWNPNRQRSAAQVARMKEVRWINNMYAWERGRHARLEVGELRPTTMIMGRKGENRSWDEYTVGEDSSGRGSSGNTSGDGGFGPYIYDADNPHSRHSSHRLSHLATPSNRGRISYMSAGSGNGPLPRQPSALLPPPIHEIEPVGPVVRRSPLRKEYIVENQQQELRRYPEEQPQRSMCMVYEELPESGYAEMQPQPTLRPVEEELQELPSQYRSPNPRITVNDQTQDSTESHSPFEPDTNFETISLGEKIGGDSSSSVDPNISPHNFSRPREGNFTTPTQRPSVIVTDGSLPQLQLNFGLPQSHSQNSVSVYDEDKGVDVNSPNERQPMNPTRDLPGRDGKENNTPPLGSREMESVEGHDQDEGGESEKENVKGMIQEWERVNGRFGREF